MGGSPPRSSPRIFTGGGGEDSFLGSTPESMASFPDEIMEHIFSFITSHRHRNSVSLVCKSWFRLERWSRERAFIGNCYAISPERLIQRFPKIKSLKLKGKPHFADFNLVPHEWGGHVYPWIEVMAKSYPWLEELRLKRMVVSDESLELLSRSFPNFKSLVLISCEGFTADGIAAIAANCRHLTELDLQENDVDDHRGHWLSCFPDTCTSLVRLNFACLKGEVNFGALERLVGRCPDLKSLRVNRSVPMDVLYRILSKAPQLEDVGTGGYNAERSVHLASLADAFLKCKSVTSLSGFWDVTPGHLQSVYSVCGNLTSLNLSYATILNSELISLIRQCTKLRKLWVLDHIGDKGLQVVASTCKDLQELWVFPSDLHNGNNAVTEEGLVAVSKGCPALHSVLYFCQQMTNAALITIANSCPRFTRFRLCIMEPKKPDHVTMQPLDEGFGAIVQSCKNLRRLSISGLLTDRAFWYIGMYAEALEMLSVAFAGDSDLAMQHVLRGCKNLRKLEIMDSPFGDAALLSDVAKYETMRSLWMSSCNITYNGVKLLAQQAPRVNVEVINDREEDEEEAVNLPCTVNDNHPVEKLYVYRTLVGPRNDAPNFVQTIGWSG